MSKKQKFSGLQMDASVSNLLPPYMKILANPMKIFEQFNSGGVLGKVKTAVKELAVKYPDKKDAICKLLDGVDMCDEGVKEMGDTLMNELTEQIMGEILKF